jgi:hypothetical protein
MLIYFLLCLLNSWTNITLFTLVLLRLLRRVIFIAVGFSYYSVLPCPFVTKRGSNFYLDRECIFKPAKWFLSQNEASGRWSGPIIFLQIFLQFLFFQCEASGRSLLASGRMRLTAGRSGYTSRHARPVACLCGKARLVELMIRPDGDPTSYIS